MHSPTSLRRTPSGLIMTKVCSMKWVDVGSGAAGRGLPRGGQYGFEDLGVAGTAAEVALEPVPDLLFRRVRVLPQEGRRVHQEAGDADTALQRRLLDELLLQLA